MNESEFREKWQSERPIYEAWGLHVVETVRKRVSELGNEPAEFFKVGPSSRTKTEESLVDKAFYRPDKHYSNPYEEIEDKVGARFVVLLVDEVRLVKEVVENADEWTYETSRNFEDERTSKPEFFAYQSVHYVVRASKDIDTNEFTVPQGTPCEVQVRTLMQHAHAELTHDAIYKSKLRVDPWVHRTVARSMALIETADDCFSEVSRNIHFGPLQRHGVAEKLDGLYQSRVGIAPIWEKSSVAIWDAYWQEIDEELADKVIDLVDSRPEIVGFVKKRHPQNNLYQQSVAFFVFWMLKNKKARLLKEWPLERSSLDTFATDLGVSVG